MRGMKRIAALLLSLLLLTAACALAGEIEINAYDYPVEEDGWYDTMEEVAVYLVEYGELPDNYLTKNEAKDLGWNSNKGNLWKVAKGCSIGGDRFGNYEGLLPNAKGRKWTECDIDFEGGYRNGKRIVFSNDGLIYYTDDHYESFDEVSVVWAQEENAGGYQDEDNNLVWSTETEEESSGGLLSDEEFDKLWNLLFGE